MTKVDNARSHPLVPSRFGGTRACGPAEWPANMPQIYEVLMNSLRWKLSKLELWKTMESKLVHDVFLMYTQYVGLYTLADV